DVVRLSALLPLEAPEPTHPDAHGRRPRGVRRVVSPPEGPLARDGVVTKAPVWLVAVHVHGPLLVHEVLLGAGEARGAGQRGEDGSVARDDGEVGHASLTGGDRLERGTTRAGYRLPGATPRGAARRPNRDGRCRSDAERATLWPRRRTRTGGRHARGRSFGKRCRSPRGTRVGPGRDPHHPVTRRRRRHEALPASPV